MSAEDTFRTHTGKSMIGSGEHAFAITPSNDADLPYVTRGLYVGVGGDVTVDMHGGETNVAFVGMVAGMLYQLRVKKVYSTGTTAGSIVGVY